MKRGKYIALSLIGIIILLPFITAGFSDWFKRITGEATDAPVDMNITVGSGNSPSINFVYVPGSQTLNLGPSATDVFINFSVSDADGADNIDDSSVVILVENGGTDRVNSTACTELTSSGNIANYSCNVTFWWFDTDGSWTIEVNITDNHDNTATNTSQTVTLNTLTGFTSGPGNLTWSTLQPGTTNQTPTNWLLLNNTGNQAVTSGNIEINATDLVGETTPSQAIYARNFSVGTSTSGADPECDESNGTATNMDVSEYEAIVGASISAGNFTINDNSTGQEQLWFCIQEIGLELSQQAYSTAGEGTWTIQIV